MRVKLKPYQVEKLNDAEKFTFDLEDGTKIQGYKWGKGPKKVLFLHGWQSHSYRWIPYVENLDPESFTCIALDAPASGESEGKYCTVFLYETMLRNYIAIYGTPSFIVGHSLGAYSILFTLKNIEELTPDAIVLLALPSTVSNFFKAYKFHLRFSERTYQLVLDAFEKQYGSVHEYDVKNIIAEYGKELPLLLIHDEEDKDASISNSKELAMLWPDAQTLYTKGFGHKLKDERVFNRVKDYLSKF